MVKVYVFKRRICPKCKEEMFSYNGSKVHKCKKCGLKVQFDDNKALGSMGVVMKGTTRDGKIMHQMSLKGFEVEKVLIPKKRYCQRCRNMATIIKNMIEKAKKKAGARELSPEETAEVIRNEVMKKLKEQHDKKVKKRKEAMERVEVKKAGKSKTKIKITKKQKNGEFKGAIFPKEPVLLTTPFNTITYKELSKKQKKEIDKAEKEQKKKNI